MPELRHLRVLLAVAQERNFTRAAERLHLAQQAVSKSIAQLERELGVELLERTSREVRPTDAGRALVADAEPIVAAADAAFARARARGQGLEGSVAVGVSSAVGPAVQHEAARRLREAAPGLSVALRELRPREAPDFLAERRVDVVLARSARVAPGLDVTELAPTPAAVLVPEGHRLAGLASVAPAELDGERLMVWSPVGTPYTDLLVARCRAAGAAVTAVETGVTGGTDLAEVVALDAVAIVPEGWPPAPGTRLTALDGFTLPLLAVRTAGAPAPAVARLIDLLREG